MKRSAIAFARGARTGVRKVSSGSASSNQTRCPLSCPSTQPPLCQPSATLPRWTSGRGSLSLAPRSQCSVGLPDTCCSTGTAIAGHRSMGSRTVAQSPSSRLDRGTETASTSALRRDRLDGSVGDYMAQRLAAGRKRDAVERRPREHGRRSTGRFRLDSAAVSDAVAERRPASSMLRAQSCRSTQHAVMQLLAPPGFHRRC